MQVAPRSSSSSSSSEDEILDDSIFTSSTQQRIAEDAIKNMRKGDSVFYSAVLHTFVAVVLVATAGTLAYFTYNFVRDQEVNQFEAKVGANNFSRRRKPLSYFHMP